MLNELPDNDINFTIIYYIQNFKERDVKAYDLLKKERQSIVTALSV